jgi:hypothetical protein
MYEYGRRAALALPVVLLKDEGSPLPFDLKDERCVDLPETTPTDIGQVAPKIRTIRQYIEDPIRKPGWKTTYPSATVDIVIGGQKDQNKYIEASSALEALFELNEITGRTLDGVIDHLAKKMARDQCTAFLGDQQRILGNLVLGKTQPVDISANVPILFDDHATLRGRAYLPIIVSHVFIQATNTFRLNVVYIEVTAATRKRDQEKYFECTLIGAVLDPAAG